MGLHARDFQSPSAQNPNAGNGGDVIKHSVYLAVLDELRTRKRWRDEVHVVETHAGKGVYVPAAKEYAEAANDPGMRRSKLCAAQEMAFQPAPHGLGPVDGMNADERPYAASALLHAFALRDVRQKSLLLMDCDKDVTDTLTRLFDEPAFRQCKPAPDMLHTKPSSEQELIDRFRSSCFGGNHVVHLDPFAFVLGGKHAQKQKRKWYAELLRKADRRVASRTLAALSVFVVWGQWHKAEAKADLCGAGCGVRDGYQDLRAAIGD